MRKVCLFIIFLFVSNIANSKIVPPKKIFSEYKLSNGQIYKSELTSARYLLEVSNALNRKTLAKSHIRIYLSKLKHSEALQEYKTLNQALRKLVITKSDDEIIHTCAQINTRGGLASEKYFLRKISRYCAKVGFDKVLKAGKMINKNHAILMAKKINHLPNLTKYNHEASIREVFVNSPSFNQEMDRLLNKWGAPSHPSRVFHYLSYAPTNKKLLEKLSMTDTSQLTSSRYFYREFKEIVQDIKSNIKKEKLFEADQSLEYALSFFHNNRRFIQKKKALKYLFSSTRLAITHGFNPFARKILLGFKSYLQKHHLDTYTFHMLWSYLEKDSLANALLYIESADFKAYQAKYDSRVLFWAGYAYHRAGKQKEADAFFQKIMQDNPLGYYSVVSHRLTNKKMPFLNPPEKDKKLTAMARSMVTKKHSSALRRLRIWSRLKATSLVNKEIYHIISKSGSNDIDLNEFKRKAILAELATEGSWLEAFKLIFRSYYSGKLKIDKEILSGLFPMEYFDTIQKVNGKTDPILILSLIRQESAFNPHARSIAGARGLMQLMPATAREMRRRVKKRHLNIPKVNLQLGIKYLSRLLNKYDGDVILTLASYNAGQGNVRSWLDTYLRSDNPLMKIEAIPFRETRNYVKFIYRNLFFYKTLMGKKLNDNVFDSFKVAVKH